MDNKQYKIFAILSEPRTGSTVISNKLGLLKGIHCQGEIFHPDEIYCSVSSDSVPDIGERNRQPVKFLYKMLEQTYLQKDKPEIIGFKLFFDHNPTITAHLLEQKIPVLLLERKNKLAQYSSLLIAKKTGKWHSKQKLSITQEEKNKAQGSRVDFSLMALLAFSVRSHYRFSRIARELKKRDVPHHYVAYEKMFADDEWHKVAEFIGLSEDGSDLQPTLKKQRKGSIIDTFHNRGYAKACCKLITMLPPLANFIGIKPSMLNENQ